MFLNIVLSKGFRKEGKLQVLMKGGKNLRPISIVLFQHATQSASSVGESIRNIVQRPVDMPNRGRERRGLQPVLSIGQNAEDVGLLELALSVVSRTKHTGVPKNVHLINVPTLENSISGMEEPKNRTATPGFGFLSVASIR